MKPTTQFNERSRQRMPKTDCAYQIASMPNRGGRNFGGRGASIRAISREYFTNEARSTFATEAAFFSVIVMTAGLPLIYTAVALVHFIHSVAAV